MKKLNKKRYTAIATVFDGVKEWNVTIYSGYETVEEANEGIKHFCEKGYNVVKTWVE